MIIVLILLAVIVSSIFVTSFLISAPRYQGPPLPHFDGRKFINPGNALAKGFPDVMKWMISRKRGLWTPDNNAAVGEAPPVSVQQGVRVTFVNHSTFLIQFDGLNILTDPVWSERTSPFTWIGPKRMRPPGIRMEDLPRIDVVLLSHNHYDHLDIRTVITLHEHFHPKFVVPLGVGKFLEENGIASYSELDWWTSVTIGHEISVEAVPAQHFSGRGMFDRDATLWCGYVITTTKGNIYFAGDSGYNGSTFKEIGVKFKPRLSIIPIGAYKPQWFMSPIHCSPAEAVQIHIDLGSHTSIASHFGTFPLADDGYDDPVSDLKIALTERGISSGDFIALQEGEGRNFALNS
jgi:L-ascorbate metabolism protein UlaG (beta-lactamase superfamily)